MSPKCFQKRKLPEPEAIPEFAPQSFAPASNPDFIAPQQHADDQGLARVPRFTQEISQERHPQTVPPRFVPPHPISSLNVPSIVQPPAPRYVPPPGPPPASKSGPCIGIESLPSIAPRMVLPPVNSQLAAPPRVVLPVEMPPSSSPRIVLPQRLEELKERLVKRRRTEDLERPPGDFGPTQSRERGKNIEKVPMDRPPGDCSASVRPSSHRKQKHREARDRDIDKEKVQDNRHGQSKDVNVVPSPEDGSMLSGAAVLKSDMMFDANESAASHATSASKGGLVNAPWRAKSKSDAEASVAKSACIASQASPVAPWRRHAEASSSTHEQSTAQPSSSTLIGSTPAVTLDGLPDLGELLRAVDQATADVVVSSPENVDEGSATEDSATEDTDYDPFEAGSEVPDAEDDEDEGIVEALFEILRSAEQSSATEPEPPIGETETPVEPPLISKPPQPTPVSTPKTPAKDSKLPASAPKSIPVVTQAASAPFMMHEEEERPKRPTPKTTYVFNAGTQRWEPKKIPATSEQKPAPKTAQAKADTRAGSARETIFVDEEPPSRPQPKQLAQPAKLQQNVIAECEMQAKADIAGGDITYPQALAVRLALRFESKPEEMLKTMEAAGLPAAKDQRSTVKAIMRLCHPDKCKHPLAKRAMQAMGPLL